MVMGSRDPVDWWDTHSSVSMGRITCKLIHSQANTWGITKSLTIGRGRLLLKIGAIHGGIGTDIIGSLWQVGPNLDHLINCGRDLCERRLWYEHVRQLVMTRVLWGQQDSFLLHWAWDPSVIVLRSSDTHRGELVSIGEGHQDSPSGFSDLLRAWDTSSTWQDGQQEDFRRSSCTRGFICIGIKLYLQGPTIRVHGVDYLVEHLHEDLGRVLHRQDALLFVIDTGVLMPISGRLVSRARGASR